MDVGTMVGSWSIAPLREIEITRNSSFVQVFGGEVRSGRVGGFGSPARVGRWLMLALPPNSPMLDRPSAYATTRLPVYGSTGG